MAENKQEWLAGPSSDCCLSNHMHQGSPQGIFQNVAGLETYISRPSEKKKQNGHVVLYFPDVWGMFKNGLLIMDSFADAGYLVIAQTISEAIQSGSIVKIGMIRPPNRILTMRPGKPSILASRTSKFLNGFVA
ncbi:hypothetical protein KC330_g5224 [Hortaea werneckii]|nr:hypothetical protein KC330_g5224 [Hortaea werneckii]